MNPFMGLDCRHPGDSHPSNGIFEHFISDLREVDNQKQILLKNKP